MIEAVSHVKVALTLPQPFLWILKWRAGSYGCLQPVAVCAENLNTGVMAMKSAQDGA